MEPFRALWATSFPHRNAPPGLRCRFFHRRRPGGRQCLAFVLENAPTPLRRDRSPDTVRYAFYAGGVALLGAIGWTVLRTREYPPDMLARAGCGTHPGKPQPSHCADPQPRLHCHRCGPVVGSLGGKPHAGQGAVHPRRGCSVDSGLPFLVRTFLAADNAFTRILDDVRDMPPAMAQLAVVQFSFSWSALPRCGSTPPPPSPKCTLAAPIRLRPPITPVPLGRGVICRLQRVCRAGRHGDSVDGAPLWVAHKPPTERGTGRVGLAVDWLDP